MQRELYEVEKDRFDLKDSSLYHLQGTWPKDHKPEAVLDGEKLPAAISAQERVSALERFKDLDLVNGERVQMEICLPDLLHFILISGSKNDLFHSLILPFFGGRGPRNW